MEEEDLRRADWGVMDPADIIVLLASAAAIGELGWFFFAPRCMPRSFPAGYTPPSEPTTRPPRHDTHGADTGADLTLRPLTDRAVVNQTGAAWLFRHESLMSRAGGAAPGIGRAAAGLPVPVLRPGALPENVGGEPRHPALAIHPPVLSRALALLSATGIAHVSA